MLSVSLFLETLEFRLADGVLILKKFGKVLGIVDVPSLGGEVRLGSNQVILKLLNRYLGFPADSGYESLRFANQLEFS